MLPWGSVDHGINLIYDATVSVFPSSAVRVCLYMIQLSTEEDLDPINQFTPTRHFSYLSPARAMIFVRCTLACFMLKDFKIRFSLLISIGIVEHYC
jgi:hypothetical protein